MKRGWKLLTLGIGGIALIVCLGVWITQDREPCYQGRSLSEWIQIRTFPSPGLDQLTPEAREAIRHIGTNAIPTALHWLNYEPSRLGHYMTVLLNRLPTSVRPSLKQRADRGLDAAEVFAVLGPDGRSAVHELTRLAMTTSSEARAYRCINALMGIGPDVIPAFNAILANPHSKGRFIAAGYLVRFSTNASPAIPVLIKSLDDNDELVAMRAAATLGELRLSNAVVIPALSAHLRSTSARRRVAAAVGLTGFGRAAEPAVPQLRQALGDTSDTVRESATNALMNIAPEALTNAPPN